MLKEPAPQNVRFGEFELDFRSGELRSGARRTLLPDQPFRILATLIRCRGALVTRDDLRRELWPGDTFVDFEPSLNAAVRRLREALGDSAEAPRYIETLPRRGYRLIAPVEEIDCHDTPPRRRLVTRRLVVTAAALVTISAAAFGVVRFAGSPVRAGRPSDVTDAHVARLTNLGTVRMASLAADGRSLAYVLTDETRESLWLRRAGAPDARLVASIDGTFRSVTVAPADTVYYTLLSPDRTDVGLYRVSAGVDTPAQLPDVTGGVAFSPDRSRRAHVSTVSLGVRESRIMIGAADGSTDRVFAVRRPPATFVTIKPVWAPDGRELAVFVQNEQAPGMLELVTIDTTTPGERSRTSLPLDMIDGLAWLRDGTRILSARQRSALPLRLWKLAPGSGALRSLTDDVSDYALAGVTPDARYAMAVRRDTARSLWIADLSSLDRPRRLAVDSGSLDGFEGIAWIGNSRVVHPALEANNLDLCSTDVTTGSRHRLTTDPADDYHPTASDDGTIAFVSDRSGRAATWIMSSDGANLRRLTDGVDTRPALAPDGRFVIVQRHGVESLPSTMWSVSVDTGTAVRFGSLQSFRPAVSPDGRFVAHYWMTPDRWTLAVTPVNGDLPVHTLPIPATHRNRVVRWSPDGKALAFVDNVGGRANIWLQPLAGGAPRALTHLTGERIESFDWSRDGSRFAWTTLTEIGDLVKVALDDAGR
jgi:Tol biopolymer transport system component/DNA-binding winged helix-turn-helix (wHTH) protein